MCSSQAYPGEHKQHSYQPVQTDRQVDPPSRHLRSVFMRQPYCETPIFGVNISIKAMGARTNIFLKDLEHRNACVGHTGKNLELPGNAKPKLQATAKRSRFSG